MAEAKFQRPLTDSDADIDRVGSRHPDVPRKLADLAKYAARVSDEVAQLYDQESKLHGVDWREYAKLLAQRIRHQRREIARLHKKVRDLRADVHERDEVIALLNALSGDERGFPPTGEQLQDQRDKS